MKNVFREISQNGQKNTSTGVSFSVKLDDTDLQLYLKRDSGTSSFRQICEICNNKFFQNTTGELLLIIAVSIVVQEKLANETINYDIEN